MTPITQPPETAGPKMKKRTVVSAGAGSKDVEITLVEGEAESMAAARLVLNPSMRHASIAMATGGPLVKFPNTEISGMDAFRAMGEQATGARKGDLGFASETLAAQIVTLDTTVTELMRRAWINGNDYPDAFYRYMGLALKAQANCRATVEALARMHQPREQVVRHVHVYEGGQAVVAEEFHHHAGGAVNADRAHQPYAQGAPIAALSGSNPIRQTVPEPSGEGEATMQDARRRPRQRCPDRQSKRTKTRP